jgi:hypothetical protein
LGAILPAIVARLVLIGRLLGGPVLAIGARQEIHVMQISTLALAALLLAASESTAQDQRRSFYDRNG